MGLFGSLVQLGFGGAPKLEEWQTVNAQEEQLRSISGNLAALPTIKNLASSVNAFNTSEIAKVLEAHNPFLKQIEAQTSKNRLDWSKGVMSQDLADQVQLQSAARAVGGGYGGTGAHNALLARNYGLTSFNLQQQAQSSEESWLRTAAAIYEPGMFNLASEFISPGQQLGFATSERDRKLSYTNLKKQFDYASDPMRGVESSVAGIADMIGTALMAYMGGGVGAMGAAGGAAGGGGGMMSGLGGMIGMGSGGGSGSAMQMLQGFFGSGGQ
jgi:hypothetical protein